MVVVVDVVDVVVEVVVEVVLVDVVLVVGSVVVPPTSVTGPTAPVLVEPLPNWFFAVTVTRIHDPTSDTTTV